MCHCEGEARGNLILILLCISSSLLLALSFPDSNIEILAWFGLVPLFFVIDRTNVKRAFWSSYLTGVLFFSFTIYWLIHVTLFGLILLVLYLAVYFGVFGGLVRLFWERCRYLSVHQYIRSLLILFFPPVLWVALEFIRTHLLTGFGWALLGYSQYLTLHVIQIADITGVYGVSFLIVLVNAGIYFLIKLKKIIYIGIPCLLLAATLIYGHYRLGSLPDTNRTLKVSVIQGNIPQDEKWDPKLRMVILEKYEVLTKIASREDPDIIIWPESSFPGIIFFSSIPSPLVGERGTHANSNGSGEGVTEDALYQKVATLARDVNIPILIGSQRNDALTGEGFNSAILVSKNGDIDSYYDKFHLVPFGEYVPLGKFFPFVGKAIDIGDFARGTEWTLFSLTQGRFGALICFEDTFPGQVRRFVKKGADFIVNITNDGWFGRTGAPYQHAQTSVFRAVENRRVMVRSANTGLSCFIDPRGEIKKLQPFITGYKTETVTLAEEKSFYTAHGDIIAMICLCISVIDIFLIANYSKSGII